MSPTGKRAAFEARGDVVHRRRRSTAPVVNVTRTSGVAERYPRWSPDGKTLAYWSDRSGEYELTLRAADGTGTEQKVTSLGAGLPLCAALVARQQEARVHRSGDAHSHLRRSRRGKLTDVDQSPDWMRHGGSRRSASHGRPTRAG